MDHLRAAIGAILIGLSAALSAPARAAAEPACDTGPFAASTANAISLDQLVWQPFRRLEFGWAVYAPRVAHEIGAACGAGTPAFAALLARWQAAHALPASGMFDAPTFAAMEAKWQAARPFVRASRACPDPPPAQTLATAFPRESYGGKLVQLRAHALAAWRGMVAAARADDAAIRREPRALTIFSGFRDPAADAARCAAEGNCDGTRRATCSAHRTGLAADLWVGQAPGYGPDSSVDANRRAMVASPAYRWLLANAARFGFVNYAFEPWHWEWTGEPVQPRADSSGLARAPSRD